MPRSWRHFYTNSSPLTAGMQDSMAVYLYLTNWAKKNIQSTTLVCGNNFGILGHVAILILPFKSLKCCCWNFSLAVLWGFIATVMHMVLCQKKLTTYIQLHIFNVVCTNVMWGNPRRGCPKHLWLVCERKVLSDRQENILAQVFKSR